jgi:hypothetical protein
VIDLSPDQRKQKLRKVAEIEGYEDMMAFLEWCAFDSVCPAICCNPQNWACNYSQHLEPDQERSWCDECQANTMKSALTLAGVI